MSIKAVIFDLGGVLVRTEDREPRAALGRRFGLTYEQMDELVFGSETAIQASVGAIPEEQHWDSVCRGLGLGDGEVAGFRTAFWGGDVLDTSLVDYIRSLRPRYRTALLSNAWSGLRKDLEQRWGILDAFDEIFISAECGMAKPDPRIYAWVTEKLGIRPEEAVFVDDFLRNVEAARAAGLHAIHFQESAQARSELEALLSGPAANAGEGGDAR